MKTVLTLLLLLFGVYGPAQAQAQTYDALNSKAMEQWKARNYVEAAKSFERGLQIAQTIHDAKKQLEMMGWLCSAYELLGDTPKALKWNEATLAFYRQHRTQLGSDDSEEEFRLRSLGSLYTKQGNYELGLKDLQSSLALCQAPKADCGADTGRILRDLGISLYFAGKLKEAEQRLREAVQSSHAFSVQAAANPRSAPSSDFELEALRWLERVLVAQHRTDEALEVSQRCRAGELSLLLTKSMGGNFSQAAAPNTSQIKKIAHAENATIVEYSVVYKSDPVIPLEFSDFEMLPAAELYIWVVHPSGNIDFRQTNFGTSGLPLATMVKEVRSAITSSGNAAERTNALKRAYQLLIAPIEGVLPVDPEAKVLFVPQDTLYLLPFAALQDTNGKYLIERHTIADEVSFEVLQLSREKFQRLPERATAVLVVGNPTMPAGFPPLPGAEKEARAVAGLFSTTALTGGQATKRTVLDRMGDARILHFATHGVLNANDAQLSSLVLAPDRSDSGFLQALEISRLKLHAEVAVLSACDTGQGRLTGDGVLGLGRSFVEAGTPTLVVSLWSIPDAPTATLMVEFYKNIRQGMDKAKALRMAMLTTGRQFPDPRAWAAFTVLGVPDASPMLRSVHGNPTVHATGNDLGIFAMPSDARNYQEDGQSFNFLTSLSLTDTIAFYRRAYQSKGYREDSALTSIEKENFSMVFLGPWKNEALVVQGSNFDGIRMVSVRLEPRR